MSHPVKFETNSELWRIWKNILCLSDKNECLTQSGAPASCTLYNKARSNINYVGSNLNLKWELESLNRSLFASKSDISSYWHRVRSGHMFHEVISFKFPAKIILVRWGIILYLLSTYFVWLNFFCHKLFIFSLSIISQLRKNLNDYCQIGLFSLKLLWNL